MLHRTLKLASIFLKFSQRYIANIIGVAHNSQIPHAILSKGYSMTFCNNKGNQQPFCKLGEGIRNTLLFSRIFPFFILQKGIDTF
jgi:hypothetical protein